MPRKLVRSPRRAEDYDEPQSRLRRPARPEEPKSTLRSSRPHPDAADSADDDSDLAVARGWEGYRRTKANAPSKWSKLYKVPDEEQLIMFLEDGPYASFLQHWCDWVPKGHKMSYICSQDDCPIDEVDTPTARVRFNILDLVGDTPLHTTYECGMTVTDILDKACKTEPLSGRYFAISMVGDKTKRTQIRPVKARDLEEDWNMKPLTEDEIAKFDTKLWTDASLERSTRKELQEVADMATE
jgi:hypothetical protein